MKFVKKIVCIFLAGLLAGNIPSTALWQVSAIGSNSSDTAIEGNGTPVSYRHVARLFSCERTNEVGLWPSGSLNSADFKEGANSLVQPGTAGGPSVWLTGSQLEGSTHGTIDLGSDITNLAVGFWVKTDNRTAFQGFEFNLSSGTGSTDNLKWAVGNEYIPQNNQWVYVTLPLCDALDGANGGRSEGTFNPRAVNFMSAQFFGDTTGMTVWYDDFAIVDLRQPLTFTVTDNPARDVNRDISDGEDTQRIQHWDSGVLTPVTIDCSGFTQGYGAYYATAGTGLQTLQILPSMMETVDLSKTVDNYLCFDFYVSDVSCLDTSMFSAQLCHSSGAFNDNDNMTWWISDVHTGWNRFSLPIQSGSKPYATIVQNGSGVTLANFFRLLINTTASCELRLDNVRITGRFPDGTLSEPSIALHSTDMDGYQKLVTMCSVTDFGADGTDGFDDTLSFQRAIAYASSQGGGTVWVPAGRYSLKESLSIPASVSLAGVWYNPDSNPTQMGSGSVIVIRTGQWDPDGEPFISLGAASCLIGLTFYHPEQNAAGEVPYPVTIQAKDSINNTSGFSTVRYCTLVNPYIGIRFGPDNNELGIVEHVYMSPLSKGIVAGMTTDIARFWDIHLSADYYASFAPNIDRTVLTNAMKSHVIGLEFGRSDWQYIHEYTAKDLHTGILIARQDDPQPALVDSSNVQIGNIAMDNVVVGIDVAYSRSNQMITKADIQADEAGIRFGSGFSAAASISGAVLSSSNGSGLQLVSGSTGMVSVMDSRFTAWKTYGIDAAGGTLVIQGCRADQSGIAVNLDAGTSTVSMDKNQGMTVQKHSSVGGYVGTGAYAAESLYETLPDFGTCPYPTGSAFLNVRDFGADPSSVTDATAAFQQALNAAAAQDGGIVYAPAGSYWIGSTLTIPTGVELRGISEAGHHTSALGTVLLTTNNAGGAGGTPFITLETGAGVRGITVWYPNQNKWNTPAAYPVTIKGAGRDVWIVNVTIANGYNGVDLTTDSGGHYVSYYCGFNYVNNITVDNSSSTGRLLNLHFNPHFYMRSQPLQWQQGWTSEEVQAHFTDMLSLLHQTLDGSVVLRGTTGEQTFGVFSYGGKTGLKLQSGFEGLLYAAGFDGNVTGYQVDNTGGTGALFINANTDCVPSSAGEQSAYMKQSAGTVRMVNGGMASFNWTIQNGISVSGGNLSMRQVMFSASGSNYTVNVSGRAKVTLDGCLLLHKGAQSPDGVTFTNQSQNEVLDLKKGLLATLTLGCNAARNFWRISGLTLPAYAVVQNFNVSQ